MSERVEEATRATREHVRLAWDEGRVEVLLQRTKGRARRRAVARAALAAAAAVALAVVGWSMWPREGAEAPPIATAPAPQPAEASSEPRTIHLGDGSIVTLLDEHAEVVVEEVSREAIRLELTRGGARFDVVPGLPRAFAVGAGEVEVSVVGTVFEVERDGAGARVRVLEGRVRVRWPPEGEALLTAGEEGRFPADQARSSSGEAHPIAVPPAPRRPRTDAAARSPRRARAAPPAWIAVAERGEYEEAARMLAEDEAMDRADIDALLLASDTMRLTGQPARALGYLDRAAALAEGDPRAPLVAFTRGRLLLTALSRPREAAEAFGAARELARDPALTMDAAAREVEALAAAGDADAARERAEEYVRRYPNGLRIDAVRRWGGLGRP